MSIILPYETEVVCTDGCFIDPDGEIMFTDGAHEKFAAEYCYGDDFLYRTHEPYSLSHLNSEELKLYKIWLKQHKGRNVHADFMTYVLGYDKVETILRRAITTTNSEPHIRFFNYYLMDHRIFLQQPRVYNPEIGKFEIVEFNHYGFNNKLDREAEEEIEDIKKNVLRKDRYLYFK